ncbi:MAG: sigma factor-like helix-turn-helix DNA-binding protein [Chthoniobacter sp.]|nr:sigma factor-like helix-turn-helix DNA-binding protein [Chthoniobacter sp.]
MSHPYTISNGPSYAVRPNGSLPASVAEEYRAGAALAGLAVKYDTYVARVTTELRAMGVTMRPKGVAPSVPARERRERMAALRGQGLSLQKIADQFDISRERVRQILDPNYLPSLRKAYAALQS